MEENSKTNETLVNLIRSGTDRAENLLQLWKQNKAFIATLARKYSGGAEMEDLEQEGFIGLCEAIPHYDEGRGMSFIGYAAFYIQKRLRACVENNRPVKLSRLVADEALQYKKLVREYTKYYGCLPSDRELCAFLHVDQDKLALIKKATETGHIRSLSEELPGMDGDICLGDTIAADEDLERDAIRRIDHEHMKRELWLAVDQLPDRLPAAIRLRYESGLTYKEMGERLGVDMNQARSLEQKAFKTLRIPSRAKRFRAYHEEYLSASQIHHVGVRRFNETWTSEVERDAIRWTEKEREVLKWIEEEKAAMR